MTLTSSPTNDPQTQLENLFSSLSAEDLMDQTLPMLAPIVNLIKNEAANYNELLEKLADIYPEMDDKNLIENLTRAYFIAETWGRLND